MNNVGEVSNGNFHTKEWIMNKLLDHYNEACTIIPEERIVGIFLQGSQNYGLDIEGSDVDSKLIVTPSLDDIIFNRQPISTTHVRANDEHIDIKDIRLYIDCFKKQNINFVEILFTEYLIVNPLYRDIWDRLVIDRENIARMSKYRSMSCFYGTAGNKYVALEHPYPSKVDILDKMGYDPKQLHHLLRLKEFMDRYLDGERYEDVLISNQSKYLKEVKLGLYDHDEARKVADETYDYIKAKWDEYKSTHECDISEYSNSSLDRAQHDIMYTSIKNSI